ncbi:6-phosphogluconolactonase [Georgenia faecalis]|uniref:6-phosphogluconolactonase n=1 Tax=Georgenia faecalis TaxID=2483799 RepID=A0ABV9DBM9_9MICO|nr:6-phosphogluconolactonase [Georgenia faecalis]
MTEHYPLQVHAYRTKAELGRAAGAHAARHLREVIAQAGAARVMLAAAPSQDATLAALAEAEDIDFSRVTFFHMDDYVGLDPDAPQGFGNWLERNFISTLAQRPTFHRLDAAAEPEAAAAAYADLMGTEPFDLLLCGLGVNGHLAFNDPGADLADPRAVRVVEMDEVSRRQQHDEGHFPTLSAVPLRAMTVTIPRLLASDLVICSVPGAPKRAAVAATLDREPTSEVPGTALKLHPDAHLYLDEEANPHA